MNTSGFKRKCVELQGITILYRNLPVEDVEAVRFCLFFFNAISDYSHLRVVHLCKAVSCDYITFKQVKITKVVGKNSTLVCIMKTLDRENGGVKNMLPT